MSERWQVGIGVLTGLLIPLILVMVPVRAEELGDESVTFLGRHAPQVLKITEQLGA